MAQAIIYCERCGKMIPPGDRDGGAMVLTDDLGVCAACLSPDERERIRQVLAGGARPAPAPASAAAAAGRGGSEDVAKAPPTRCQGAARSTERRASRRSGAGKAGQRAPSGRRTGLVVAVVAIVAAGALAGVAIALSLVAGGPERPNEGRERVPASSGRPAEPDGSAAAAVEPAKPPASQTVIPARERLDQDRAAPAEPPSPPRSPAEGSAGSRRTAVTERLEAIKLAVGASPPRHAEARESIGRFLQEFPRAPEAAEARELLARVEADFDRAAERGFEKATADARALFAKGESLGAGRAFDPVRERFAESRWFRSRGEKAIYEALRAIETDVPEGDPIAPVKGPGLVGRWVAHRSSVKGREAAATIDDQTGNNPGEVRGRALLVRAGRLPPGRGVAALRLDGSASVMLREDFNQAKLPREKLTATAWVRVDQPAEWGCIIGAFQDNGKYERGWLLGYRGDKFTFAVATSGRAMTYLTASEPFRGGKWAHVAGTYDGREMKLYVDGSLARTSTDQAGPVHYPPKAFFELGAYHDDNEYHRLTGMIHEARLYETALDADAVRAEYEAKAAALGLDAPAVARAGRAERDGRDEGAGEPSGDVPGETDGPKKADVASASAGAATDPEEAWEAFLLGLADAGGKGLAEAKSYVQQKRAEMKELGLADDVGRIERRFNDVRLVEELAEVGFRSARGTVRVRWKGEKLAGRIEKVEDRVLHIKAVGGRSLEVPISEVGAEDVVSYSQIMRSTRSGTKDPVKAATYCLLRGEAEAAQRYLKGAAGRGAWELGDDVDELADLVKARRERESAARNGTIRSKEPDLRAAKTAAAGAGEAKNEDKAAGGTAAAGRTGKPARKKVPVDFEVKDVETYRCPKPTVFANVFSFGYGGDRMPKDDARFEVLLKKLKAGGFNTVHATHTDSRLALCRKHGTKMMIDLLAEDEGQHVYKTVDTVEALCRKLRGNSDLWGYGIWHDPFGKMAAGRKRDISNVRRWDPTHPAYCGTYRTGGMGGVTNPDVFGFYDFHWKRAREYHFPHLLRFRKWAIERDAYVYRWLATDSGKAGLGNYNRSLYTATTSIACGLKGVIWFIGTRLMDKNSLEWKTNGHDIMKVNGEIMPLADEIPRLGNPVAVYSTPMTRTANDKDLPEGKTSMMPPGLDGHVFPSGFWIEPQGGEFVMGVFKDDKARDAVFVANNNAYQEQDVKLKAAAGRKASIFDRKSRSWRALRASKGVISFKLAEAGGELLRFEK